ncbi:hypothetical protein pipiens_018864 [Culex pipiens pipiens]|uniref:Uncharacterized protein n=1 Tax=Culex pipiens pipiens TaxID=38569 RepID=A0ABD1E035_CULPP
MEPLRVSDAASWLQFDVHSRDTTREAAYCDEQLVREVCVAQLVELAMTELAPEYFAQFVDFKTLELFLSSGNIVNGSRFFQPSSSGRSEEM